MMMQEKHTVDTQQHVAAVEAAWHRSGRQAAAEVLMQYDACTLADSRAAAEVLRQTWAKWAADAVIETANYLRNVYGHCPGGTL